MRNSLLITSLLATSFTISINTNAKEGMFTPDQLQEIAKDLKKTGLKLPASSLSDLTAFPMGAVISLGGCTASFVSPKGLVVTNHHCVRGSIQYNSTKEHNYLKDGFLAKTIEEEVPAAPGSRIYVTVELKDVTDKVLAGVTDEMSGIDRYQAIDKARKQLIKDCEQEAGYRCQVPAFYGGLQYKLIKRLEIRDVRLVYAPGDNIGKYGGDIDNWMWPRHTGDFGFYRAYIAKDGSAADYSKDNVPYKPKHFLKVSSSGLDAGDFVMAAGYPGRTSRYARLAEVKNTFDWLYPTYQTMLDKWIKTIEANAPKGSEARIKYEARLAGLNNFMKNLGGQIEGAKRVGLVERRKAREAELDKWIAADKSRANFASAIKELDALAEESALKARQGFYYNNATRPQLLSAAQRLYRLAKERQKPDAERERGYQERDMNFFKQGLKRIDRRYDARVDMAEWEMFLRDYLARPNEERVAVFDKAMGLENINNVKDLSAELKVFYQNTKLSDNDYRLSLMDKDPAYFENSNDPFIKLAVALYDFEMSREKQSKDRSGRSSLLRPKYMQAIIDWQKSKGYTAYPDANSTLRVTYGNVLGGSPKDGLIYEPFTRLEGILQKDTGEEPFDAPKKQLELIEAKDYGAYLLKSIGSVPVNFLSDLDSTGGNSGSATMNAKGELVGLLFDGTIESVNSDWDFDPRTTRTIHVDTRYMLWVMEKLDGAGNLIDEMTIVKTGWWPW